MNINRHNYEEYFLLYVDNELSVADRKAVDLFISQNPDLRQELNLLQQTVLEPEMLALPSKAGLQKSEEPTPLQVSLLSYLDNELSPAAKAELDALLLQDEAAARELSDLRRTQLEPENIVFADKASLYRHEEGVRVIRIKWWQIAAAALLLGFGTWTGVRFYRNAGSQPGGNNPVAVTTGQNAADKTTATGNPAAGNNNNTTAVVADKNTGELADNKITPAPRQQANTNTAITGTSTPAQTVAKNRLPASGNENTVAANTVSEKKPSNNLPKPYFENINNRAGNEMVATNVTPKNESNNGINSGNDNQLPSSSNRNPYTNKGADINGNPAVASNNAAIPAVYNPDNNDRLVDLQDERGKRSKLGGFLRKVKRTLERTANIKTGDEVKVAGFEIAIK